jgi:glycosyltransferase involved in cell wall biosynthesis
MNILQIIYESFGSPFGFGGAGVRAYEIYGRLKSRHDITLLCMKYPGAEDGEIHGLKHIFVGTESRSLPSSVLHYTVKASGFVKKHGNDFDVIVENFLPSTPFFSKFRTKSPVLLQIQGIMEKHSLRKFSPIYSLPMYYAEMIYPGFYDRFIFVSDVTRGKVMKRVKRAVSFCEVIPNGVDKCLLNTLPLDGNYILFFSRLDVHTKGLDLLLSAFATISPAFPDIRLILAGYEYNSFNSLVSSLPDSLKSRVTYAGFVTGDEKIDLLSNARIVVLPSRHESQPVSILEAAASGKPVIVSDIPELAFVAENNFGLSFPSGSADGLSVKLGILLRDAALRRKLGGQGKKYAKNFPWDSVAIQFENALELIVHGQKKTKDDPGEKPGCYKRDCTG